MGVLLQQPSDSLRVCLGRELNNVDIDLLDDRNPTCAMSSKYLVELLERKTRPRLH